MASFSSSLDVYSAGAGDPNEFGCLLLYLLVGHSLELDAVFKCDKAVSKDDYRLIFTEMLLD